MLFRDFRPPSHLFYFINTACFEYFEYSVKQSSTVGTVGDIEMNDNRWVRLSTALYFPVYCGVRSLPAVRMLWRRLTASACSAYGVAAGY